jgi:hypothetical protein
MTIRLERVWAVLAAAVLSTTPLLAGCGGQPAAKTATIKPGDMPSGANWTGVYYSELYGHLHLTAEGNAVSGKWIRPVKDRGGELHGEATGDVIRFQWTERICGGVGPKTAKTGHGYFKYQRPAGDNVDDKIVGETGEGLDEVGIPWDAVKQRNVTPDLASITCGGGASDLGGGDWDGDNKDKGAPEAPAPPPPP